MEAVMKLPRATCLAGLLGGECPGSESLLVTGGWAGPFRHTSTGVRSTFVWSPERDWDMGVDSQVAYTRCVAYVR